MTDPASEEVQVGAGKYTLTARGSIAINVIFSFAILGGVGWVAVKQQENFDTLTRTISAEHRANERLARLQTCVLSMTIDERIAWRNSRDAQNALMMFCPGLLLSPAQ